MQDETNNRPVTQEELEKQLEYVAHLREVLEREIRSHNPQSLYLDPLDQTLPVHSTHEFLTWRFTTPMVRWDETSDQAHMRLWYKSPASDGGQQLGYAATAGAMDGDSYLVRYEFVKTTAEQIARQWWDEIKRKEKQ